MVQNHTCWHASCTLGLSEQRNSYQSILAWLCFGTPTVQLVSQHVWFCTSLLDELTIPANRCVRVKDHKIVPQSSNKHSFSAGRMSGSLKRKLTTSRGRVKYFSKDINWKDPSFYMHRSSLLGACNSYNKPMQRHFYRPCQCIFYIFFPRNRPVPVYITTLR